MKQRLLKRISHWEVSETTVVTGIDINELSQSIQDDLTELYNTRHGTVLISSEYGLADFSYMMNAYTAPDVSFIQKSILDATRNFEKRLYAVDVRYDESRGGFGKFCFILNAKYNHKNQEVPFSINICLYDDGSVTVGR